ncbi:hypothetical protein CHH28_04580 [Bacterioplanes sanyensis]|uniref:histidine kinase n=1 Tax=Bacterioplanes sanyensis TaxID=1249553 RepID=A0A222FG74_9GAMM|nr:ATP-binding protein [Bacterioplanes sanyensis]ASP37998.1 hypothetical protein CHH28_04580 [Bacterioplanes sanyensis]
MGPAFYYQSFAMMSMACAVFLWPLYLLNRQQPAMRPWLIASICLPMGPLLLPLQIEGHLWWGVTFANHCLMAWTMLTMAGVLTYCGWPKKTTWQLSLLLTLSFSLPFNYYTWIDFDTRARIIIYSLMYIVAYSISAYVVSHRFGWRTGRYGVNLMFAMCLLMVVIMLVRLTTVLFDTTFHTIMDGRLINLAVSSVGYFVCYGLVLSYALLMQEDRQLELALLQQQAQHNAAAKSRFLATLSHELRTPLNAIAGLAEGLQSRRPEPGIRQDCSAIIDHAMGLSQLARDVLVQSEQEHSESHRPQQVVMLDSWLRCLVAGLQPLVQRPEVSLRLECDQKLGCRRIDSVRLRQVLTNLISNAVKYTEAGEVVVSAQSTGAQTVLFAVKDTGRGIAKEDIQRLLLPFTRAEKVRDLEGSGLGLSLAQQWLRQMDSRLQCESEAGRGSRFSFSLALIHDDEELAAEAVPLDVPLAVLVVEDVLLNRDLIVNQLRQLGHWVASVGSLAEARQHRRQHHVDVIILDMNLPDGDGLSLLPWLSEQRLMTDVIAFTADNSQQRHQRLVQAGVDSVLTKPLTIAALADALRPLQEEKLDPLINHELLEQTRRYMPPDLWPQQLQQSLTALLACVPLPIGVEAMRPVIHRIASQSASLGLSRVMSMALNLLDQDGPIQSSQCIALEQLLVFSVERLREQGTVGDHARTDTDLTVRG